MVFSKKNRMLTIEIKDRAINKDVCKLIISMEKSIINLKNILEKGAPGDKEAELKDLLTKFYKAHRDLEQVSLDISGIENIEAQERGYVTLKDQGFLRDKYMQVRKTRKILNELIEMLEDRPTDQELERDLLNRMISDVNSIIESVNGIIEDDKGLEQIYKKNS